MIAPLLRASRISLRRDRVAQVMTFVLPIAFFSIFAMVFGRGTMNEIDPIGVVVVDEDRSPMSQALVAALEREAALRVRDSALVKGSRQRAPVDRARARAMVQEGDAPVALVIPAGFGATFPNPMGGTMPVDVLVDPSEQIARQIVTGQLQRAAARVMRDRMSAWMGTEPPPASDHAAAGTPDPLALVPANVTEIAGERDGRDAAMISFYAAGIAVMFLLFSTSAGAGTLLDEQETGTLERVVNTPAGMSGLLVAKWLHLVLLGVLQITVMFAWGALVFGLDLLGHLPGFAVMTLCTAAAAAGFGLVLAGACRTRQQLGGVSTLVILVMSALGGSMFPRFLMSEGMQKAGLATFNAWALDGYIKVFWRDLPVAELWPQVLVLIGLAALFLATARVLARRWERA